MFIEDIIDKIGIYIYSSSKPLNFLNKYHLDFIANISDQLDRGIGLTKKQADLVVKILNRYVSEVSNLIQIDISNFIINPQFKIEKRILSQDRYIKISDIDNKKIIEVFFPYNEELIQHIRNYQKDINKQKKFTNFFSSFDEIRWNSVKRCWEFSLKEEHVVWLSSNFIEFHYDDEFLKYVEEILEIQKDIDRYVPMVTYDEEFRFVNSHKNIPQPTSSNLIEVLLEAKRHGISVWDESINYALNSSEINPVLRLFFNHTSNEPLCLNEENSSLEKIEEIIEFSKHILFVIPGGSELFHLEKIYEFLKTKNAEEKDMSVLFRLDNNLGKTFNEFVKEKQLNSPLNKKTKYVFVSGKLPKPILSNQNNFDLIVHFGTNSAHYTLKNYIRNHHTVITLNLINDNKEFNFGDM